MGTRTGVLRASISVASLCLLWMSTAHSQAASPIPSVPDRTAITGAMSGPADTPSGSGSGIQSNAPAEQQIAAEGPVKGSNEFAIWSGGGPSINGGEHGIGSWNAGLRYGRVLTGLHGPSVLRGRFAYTFDIIPVFWVFQPGGTAYGGGFDPLGLKWEFSPRRRIQPYANLTGGVIFTNRQTPPGISRVNFIPSAALGMSFLHGRNTWSGEVRFLHISDAGLTSVNPGINTLQVRLSLGIFTQPRQTQPR